MLFSPRWFRVFWFAFAVPAYAGPGFFPWQDPQVPEPVQRLHPSVFRISVIGKEIGRLDAADYDRFLDRLAACDLAALRGWHLLACGPVEQSFYGELVRAARPQPSVRLPAMVAGTGFLLFDARTVVLPRHILADYGGFPAAYVNATNAYDAGRALRGWRLPPLRLSNAAGETIFDSRRGMDTVKRIVFDGHPHHRSRIESVTKLDAPSATELFDFLVLELSRELPGTPLGIRDDRPAAGEAVFGVGFPTVSRNRAAEFGVPDADGSLRVTIGKTLAAPPADYVALLERTVRSKKARDGYFALQVFSDLDLVAGISGAPVVDARGRLVGMACTVRHLSPDPTTAYRVTASFGPCGTLIRYACENCTF